MLKSIIFYGNYFYGICVVALILETRFQLNLIFNSNFVYLISFLLTVVFYNYPYTRSYTSPSNNPRIVWQSTNRKLIFASQIVCTILAILLSINWIINYCNELKNINLQNQWQALLFPIIALAYYGLNLVSKKINLRKIGWLKPFIIGFVWAGITNYFPILISEIETGKEIEIYFIHYLLFFKTLMFTAMLAIMFDIKDYVADYQSGLKTLIVRLGIRKTFLKLIIPFTLLGLLTFLTYALLHNFSFLKITLTAIPFILLVFSIKLFRKKRSLMFYLFVIDGMFLVKAFFGIIASIF